MHIVVTGGLGFMGSNFIRFMLNRYPNYFITNLDKMTYAGNPHNVADLADDPRYTFVKGDIADAKTVDEVVRDADCVINYAAETHVDRSIIDPAAFLKTDIYGTFNLLECVRKYSIPLMIQISTDEVYGEVMTGESSEISPLRTSSPYSASKAAGDHFCEAYYRSFNTPVILTRSCNYYGPYQYPEKLIPLFITNLLEQKTVPMYGDGSQVREWIYPSDHCSAIDFLRCVGVPGEVYNIGTGERKTNKEVTFAILNALGLGEDSITHVKDRSGHDRRYALNSQKLRSLGWSPFVLFDQGIEETIKWYAEHRDWWTHIKSGDFLDYYKAQYVNR